MLLNELVARTTQVDDDCWEWNGARSRDGYGHVRVDKRTALAHRVSYELSRGPIPDGLQLDHLCRNRACINPAHLEPVTQQENAARGSRATATACVNGHLFDATNTYLRPGGAGRDCRQCIRDRVRRYNRRQKGRTA